jgi:hypothetical protein
MLTLMRIVIQFTVSEELKALPILLRHSQGMVLPDRVYVVDSEAVRLLHEGGVRFSVLSREVDTHLLEGAAAGERV